MKGILIKEIGRRVFAHQSQNYDCTISVKVAQGKVTEIEFAWDRKPPFPLSELEGEREWEFECFAAIDAEFGANSTLGIEVRVTVPGLGNVTNSEIMIHRALRN